MLDLEKAVGRTAVEVMECHGASELVSRHKSSFSGFSYVIYQVQFSTYLRRVCEEVGNYNTSLCHQGFPLLDGASPVQ